MCGRRKRRRAKDDQSEGGALSELNTGEARQVRVRVLGFGLGLGLAHPSPNPNPNPNPNSNPNPNQEDDGARSRAGEAGGAPLRRPPYVAEFHESGTACVRASLRAALPAEERP